MRITLVLLSMQYQIDMVGSIIDILASRRIALEKGRISMIHPTVSIIVSIIV